MARATAASTVQSLQTCMYVPARQSERERWTRRGGGSEGKEEEGGGGGIEQRRVNGEYVESGRQDGGVPQCTYIASFIFM